MANDDSGPGAARSRQRGGIGARFREVWRAFRGERTTPDLPATSDLDMIPDDEEPHE